MAKIYACDCCEGTMPKAGSELVDNGGRSRDICPMCITTLEACMAAIKKFNNKAVQDAIKAMV